MIVVFLLKVYKFRQKTVFSDISSKYRVFNGWNCPFCDYPRGVTGQGGGLFAEIVESFFCPRFPIKCSVRSGIRHTLKSLTFCGTANKRGAFVKCKWRCCINVDFKVA